MTTWLIDGVTIKSDGFNIWHPILESGYCHATLQQGLDLVGHWLYRDSFTKKEAGQNPHRAIFQTRQDVFEYMAFRVRKYKEEKDWIPL